MKNAPLIAILAVGTVAAISIGPRPAYADHAADCAAFAVEAKALQDSSGLWLGERRMLNGRRNRTPPGTPAYDAWLETSKSNRVKMVALLHQVGDMEQRLIKLNGDSPCAERSAIAAALGQANTFLTQRLDQPKRELPPGYCAGSPDLSAPLVPCPPKPGPNGPPPSGEP